MARARSAGWPAAAWSIVFMVLLSSSLAVEARPRALKQLGTEVPHHADAVVHNVVMPTAPTAPTAVSTAAAVSPSPKIASPSPKQLATPSPSPKVVVTPSPSPKVVVPSPAPKVVAPSPSPKTTPAPSPKPAPITDLNNLSQVQKAKRVLGALISQVPNAFALITSGGINNPNVSNPKVASTAGAVTAPTHPINAAPVAMAVLARHRVAPANPFSPEEAAAGAAMWTSTASEWDQMTMTPFHGPPELLQRFTQDSPEVQALLKTSHVRAQATLAQARTRLTRAAIAKRTLQLAKAAAASGVSTGHVMLPRTHPGIHAMAATATNTTKSTNMTKINGTTNANATHNVTHHNISGISGEFAWDGATMFGVDLTLSGPNITADDHAAAKDLLRQAFNFAVPGLDWEPLPLANTPLMDLSAAYDVDNQTLAFNASSGNYLWLLNGIADQAKATFGVTLPTYDANTTTATTAISLVADNTGLQQLSLGLGGSWTAGTLANAVGAQWPLDDGIFSVSNPSVVYTGMPLSLGVTMAIDVPEFGIANATTSLNVQPGNSLELSVYGNFQPFPALTLEGFDMSVVKGVGLQGMGLGSIGNTPFNVTGTLSGNKTNRAVKMTLLTSDVGVTDVLNGVFKTNNMVPEFITNFCAPLSFRNITLTYDSTLRKKKKFGIKATPNLDKATALQSVFKTVGLDPADLALSIGQGQIQLGVSKAYNLDLPTPFTGPSNVSFALAADAVTKEFALSGAFAASLTGKGLASPVGIAASASIGLFQTNGVNVGLSGATTTPIVIEKFPWLAFGALSVSGAVTPATPPVLNHLEMAGSLNVLGANASAQLFYDKESASLAMSAALDSLDLQKMINAAGVDFNLGILNFQLQDVAMSYATVPVPTYNIPQGMYYRGTVGFLGMTSTTAFALNEDGVDFNTLFNATEANRIIGASVLGKLDAALQVAGNAINSAGGDLQKAKADAQANLNKTLADLDAAKLKVKQALQVFDAAKAKAAAGVADATAKVNAAQAAFDDANNKAQAALAQAQQAYLDADRAFQNALSAAQSHLQDTYRTLSDAQNNYNNVVNDANNKLNEAQANVNQLWDAYNSANSQCDAWPWNYGHCIDAGADWTAYQAATLVLDGARGFVNKVMNGAEKLALDAAWGSVMQAQAAVFTVGGGIEAAARATALGVLNAAKTTANGVLSGTEAAALGTAKAVLSAAQDVANGVLSGTEFVAWQGAVAGLDAAKGNVKAAQAIASGTLDALTKTLNAVAAATKKIHTVDWFKINTLGLRITATKAAAGVGVSYDLAIAQQAIKGSASVDVSNPLDMITNLLKTPALNKLKTIYPELATFLVLAN